MQKGLTTLALILTAAGIVFLAGAGYLLFVRNKAEAPVLGGDRDAHGCIGSAGYAWCEAKQKCLRPWEESCAAPAGTPFKEDSGELLRNGTDYFFTPHTYNPKSDSWSVQPVVKLKFTEQSMCMSARIKETPCSKFQLPASFRPVSVEGTKTGSEVEVSKLVLIQ